MISFSLDLDLVRSIEHSIACAGRDTAIAANQLKAKNFAHAELAGGIAVFTGIDSPLTQALAVGLNGPVSAEELDQLEAFFLTRNSDVALELSPYIHSTLLELLKQRPYRLEEFSNVLLRPITPADLVPPIASEMIEIHVAETREFPLFTRTVAQGYADEMPITPELLDVVEGFAHLPNTASFLAFVDGTAAGGGSVSHYPDAQQGGLFGASTLPEFRRRGIQTALMRARLKWLAERGCAWAHIITHPGTSSQRNMERAGFRATYSRTKLIRNRS